jgi:hypothetical protein
MVHGSQFENKSFTEMCSGSEAGSYLGLRVMKKKTSSWFGVFRLGMWGPLQSEDGTPSTDVSTLT